jgi:hypothetical protein
VYRLVGSARVPPGACRFYPAEKFCEWHSCDWHISHVHKQDTNISVKFSEPLQSHCRGVPCGLACTYLGQGTMDDVHRLYISSKHTMHPDQVNTPALNSPIDHFPPPPRDLMYCALFLSCPGVPCCTFSARLARTRDVESASG